MGILDLPGPVFGLVDQIVGELLPGRFRLALWGVFAGWLTMVCYRRMSNQSRIGELKALQKEQQRLIADFDGEFNELLPVIRHALGLGLKQLGLSLGPALLSALPVLFLIVWVAGAFGHSMPNIGQDITVQVVAEEDQSAVVSWDPAASAVSSPHGWVLRWPDSSSSVRMSESGSILIEFPFERAVPIVHKRSWWNWLMANPIGYLPENTKVDRILIDLPSQEFIPFGPDWIRGWMFTFFMFFLLSSVVFKFLLRID